MITTHTGKYVNPLDLKPEEIDIRDIAHSLSMVNRFNGHTAEQISVEKHSLMVCNLVSRENQLQALLHDATEAYLGDITKWLKQTPEFAAYREAEDRAWKIISEKFGVDYVLTEEVEAADKLAVRIEGYHLIGSSFHLFQRPSYPLPSLEEIERCGWKRQESWYGDKISFLLRFSMLAKENPHA
jgi:hypothetical protein